MGDGGQVKLRPGDKNSRDCRAQEELECRIGNVAQLRFLRTRNPASVLTKPQLS